MHVRASVIIQTGRIEWGVHATHLVRRASGYADGEGEDTEGYIPKVGRRQATICRFFGFPPLRRKKRVRNTSLQKLHAVLRKPRRCGKGRALCRRTFDLKRSPRHRATNHTTVMNHVTAIFDPGSLRGTENWNCVRLLKAALSAFAGRVLHMVEALQYRPDECTLKGLSVSSDRFTSRQDRFRRSDACICRGHAGRANDDGANQGKLTLRASYHRGLIRLLLTNIKRRQKR